MSYGIKKAMNLLITLAVTALFASPMGVANAKEKTAGLGPAIISACQKMVKRKMPEVKDTKPYCECAVTQHLTKTTGFNKKMADWLINLYNEKQTAQAIEKDPYGIAAFDIEVFEKCQAQLNLN